MPAPIHPIREYEPLAWADILDLAEYLETLKATMKVTFITTLQKEVKTVDELYELMTLYGSEFSTIMWERNNDEILVDIQFRSIRVTTKYVNLLAKIRECIEGLGYRSFVANIHVT
jgi:hypothetical protein